MRLHLPNDLLRRADADLSDLTASVRCGDAHWVSDEVDVLEVPLDPEPCEADCDAIRRRLVTRDAAEEAHLYNMLRDATSPLTPSYAKTLLWVELAKYGETP